MWCFGKLEKIFEVVLFGGFLEFGFFTSPSSLPCEMVSLKMIVLGRR